MGAYWSVHAQDGAAFERYLSQLVSLYELSIPPPSSRMDILLGLRLLYLLVTGRRSEFHSSLARLGDRRSTKPIEFVIELEQCLVEGTFNRLLLARNQVPAPEYTWFVDALLDTVRFDLALGLERSFATLDVPTATALLLLDQPSKLEVYSKQRSWLIQNNQIHFSPTMNNMTATATAATPAVTEECTLPEKMIPRALLYATELEQIV